MRWAGVRDLLLCMAAVVVLLLASAMDKPPEPCRAAVTAATVAASEEFDRILEVYGDRDAAMEASNRRYEEVLLQWAGER